MAKKPKGQGKTREEDRDKVYKEKNLAVSAAAQGKFLWQGVKKDDSKLEDYKENHDCPISYFCCNDRSWFLCLPTQTELPYAVRRKERSHSLDILNLEISMADRLS